MVEPSFSTLMREMYWTPDITDPRRPFPHEIVCTEGDWNPRVLHPSGRDIVAHRMAKAVHAHMPRNRVRDLGLRTCHTGVAPGFSRPGKPTDNASIESFNGKLRAQRLNARWFTSLDVARAKFAGSVVHRLPAAHGSSVRRPKILDKTGGIPAPA